MDRRIPTQELCALADDIQRTPCASRGSVLDSVLLPHSVICTELNVVMSRRFTPNTDRGFYLESSALRHFRNCCGSM